MLLFTTSTFGEKTFDHFCFTYVLQGSNIVVGLFTCAHGVLDSRFTKLTCGLLCFECDKSSKFMKFVWFPCTFAFAFATSFPWSSAMYSHQRSSCNKDFKGATNPYVSCPIVGGV